MMAAKRRAMEPLGSAMTTRCVTLEKVWFAAPVI
jgi:hypothetical protein